MPFDEFPDFCSLAQDTAHIYRVITSLLNSVSKEEACSENIRQKQISLVPSKTKQLTVQISLMYVLPGRLNAPFNRRNTITWDFENWTAGLRPLNILNLWKEKAFGDVPHFSLVLEDASLQNKGSHNRPFFSFCRSITLYRHLSSSDREILCNQAMCMARELQGLASLKTTALYYAPTQYVHSP